MGTLIQVTVMALRMALQGDKAGDDMFDRHQRLFVIAISWKKFPVKIFRNFRLEYRKNAIDILLIESIRRQKATIVYRRDESGVT